jgi:hypothetical protein
VLARRKASPLHVVWYEPPPKEGAFEYPELDTLFRGLVEVAVFRSAWNDPDALFAGIKAGYNQVNHGHLDLGVFELDALGVRWARDLGADNYNLPGYWDGKKGGKRWDYYRLNSLSHSVPLLAGEGQDPNGRSEITVFESQPERAHTVVDFTSAYAGRANRAVRGLALTSGRRAVLVQDEFLLEKPCDVTWAMTTDAKIETDASGGAVLTLGKKRLEVSILSPEGARFEVESAEQEPPQKTNKGVRRLVINLGERKDDVCIAVHLAPVWPEAGAAEPPDVVPVSKW